jgi:uncharacterized peroxidase-related enzyme
MAFIETTPPEQTTGAAREMLERQQRSWGFVPNYAKVFSDRAEIMNLWADLLAGIRRHIDRRRFELVTFVAARQLRSSYCALAHGRVLQQEILSREEMRALVDGDQSHFSEAEVAMMDLARKVIDDSSAITAEDIDRMRSAGFAENEIFDVVTTAAARAFFAKIPDALGARPDVSFLEMEEALRERLTPGRPIGSDAVQRL